MEYLISRLDYIIMFLVVKVMAGIVMILCGISCYDDGDYKKLNKFLIKYGIVTIVICSIILTLLPNRQEMLELLGRM